MAVCKCCGQEVSEEIDAHLIHAHLCRDCQVPREECPYPKIPRRKICSDVETQLWRNTLDGSFIELMRKIATGQGKIIGAEFRKSEVDGQWRLTISFVQSPQVESFVVQEIKAPKNVGGHEPETSQ